MRGWEGRLCLPARVSVVGGSEAEGLVTWCLSQEQEKWLAREEGRRVVPACQAEEKRWEEQPRYRGSQGTQGGKVMRCSK